MYVKQNIPLISIAHLFSIEKNNNKKLMIASHWGIAWVEMRTKINF